jgi:RNA polymerase sigma-70 factor, ECF subfamily
MQSAKEIVEACRQGDEAAWEILVRQHTRLVYGTAYRFTGNHSAAEDLTQETFLRVFRSLGTFRAAEASFTTWLTRLTRNILIDHYRGSSQDRVTESSESHHGFEHLAARAASHPERMLAAREAADLVQSILLLLEPELREAIVYRDIEDMDYSEIAAAVGIPVGTVKSRLNRARSELLRLTRRYRTAA